MKNNQIDLHNHLFEQLERLNDEDLKGDKLLLEIKRGNAMACVAREIITNSTLALKAKKYEHEGYVRELPEQLEEKALA
jgi:hypothetical protein